MPLKTIEYISPKFSQRVFFLLDEVQEWFSWHTEDKRHRNESAIDSMQKIFKEFVVNGAAPLFHFAFTGSCMAQAWLNIVHCPTFGFSLKSSLCIQLPAQVRQPQQKLFL